jgi:D-3-phosphoglycerate dehydrogenase / 2-oxoglutarate reductase
VRVVFTDFTQPDLELERRLLGEAGLALAAAEPQCTSEDEVIRAADGATALIIQAAPISERVLTALPALRIVSVPGIGVDMIDTEAARTHGVWVANVPDANITEVACHTIAMVLSLIRHLPFYDAAVRAGGWHYEGTGPLTRPAEMTLGVVGLGRIGRLAAAYAAPVFGRIVGYDPHLPDTAWPQGVARERDLSALFAASDAVTLHLPLTAATRGLVGRDLLAAMKPGSYLVNVSRGAIVEIPDLLAALDSGQLASAALDVLPEEPPAADEPVLKHPKVLLSPHAAFYSRESDEELRRRAVTNVLRFFETGRPQHIVVEGTR